jgi:arginyl-tRNA synthetase
VEACANLYQPHHLTIYLIELSTIFHNYYHCHRVLTSDLELTKARLVLVKATKSVAKTGLSLLGISAPERM